MINKHSYLVTGLAIVMMIILTAVVASFLLLRESKQQPATWTADLKSEPFHPIQVGDASHSSSTFIRLTWQKPEQTYNHFLVTITNPQTGWERKESGEHERVSLDVSDLEPDTLYTFIVQACSDPKCTSWMTSEKIEGRTDKVVLKITEVKLSDDLLLKENWEKTFGLERSTIYTADETPWTENKNDWKIVGVFEQKNPFTNFVKITSLIDSKKSITAEVLNP